MVDKKERKSVALVMKYKSVFNTDDGRKILYDLLRRSNVLHSSFNGMDYLTMAYNEGRRSLMLYILSQIDTDPEHMKELIEKSIEEENIY